MDYSNLYGFTAAKSRQLPILFLIEKKRTYKNVFLYSPQHHV